MQPPRPRGRHPAPTAVLAAAALIAAFNPVLGGVTYNGGSVSVTYRPGSSGNPIDTTRVVNPVPSSGVIGTGGFQLDRTNSIGSNQAAAKASIGHVVNATTASFTLRPGTGVRQTDPGNAFPHPSKLTITVNRMDFQATSSPTGSLRSGYFSFGVGGKNESTSFKSRLRYDLTLRNIDTGAVVGQFGPATRDYFGNVEFGFSDVVTLGAPLAGGAIPVGQRLRISGVVELETALPASAARGADFTAAAGDFSPGFIELKHLTFGAAADVHTYVAVTTNPQNWSTASGWRRFDGVQAPASGSQHLALMPNDQGLTRTIILDSARTVGVLDVSGSSFTRIQPLLAGNPGGSPALTLGSGSHPATIRVGGEAGNAGLDLNTRVFVGSDLEINSETGLGPLFDATITFNTAGATLAKTGDGNAFIDGPVVANNLRVDHRAGQTFQRSSLTGANAAVGVSGDAASVWRTTVDQSIASLRVSGDAAAVVEGAGRRVLKTRDLHLDPTGDARLDLTDGGLVFDYSTGAEADRLAFIAAEVARARGASGDWTGGGIGSSVARAQPGLYAVGFAPKSAVAGSTFMGVAVDATSILARSTYLGDATLDGSVGIADFSVLAAHFNGTGRSWHQGDFSFDGTTDIADFALLAANFNRALPADATDAAGWTARGVEAASRPVPEPSVGVAAMAGLAIARRRRRSNR